MNILKKITKRVNEKKFNILLNRLWKTNLKYTEKVSKLFASLVYDGIIEDDIEAEFIIETNEFEDIYFAKSYYDLIAYIYPNNKEMLKIADEKKLKSILENEGWYLRNGVAIYLYNDQLLSLSKCV